MTHSKPDALTKKELDELLAVVKGDVPTDDWTDESLAKIDAVFAAARKGMEAEKIVRDVRARCSTDPLDWQRGWVDACDIILKELLLPPKSKPEEQEKLCNHPSWDDYGICDLCGEYLSDAQTMSPAPAQSAAPGQGEEEDWDAGCLCEQNERDYVRPCPVHDPSPSPAPLPEYPYRNLWTGKICSENEIGNPPSPAPTEPLEEQEHIETSLICTCGKCPVHDPDPILADTPAPAQSAAPGQDDDATEQIAQYINARVFGDESFDRTPRARQYALADSRRMARDIMKIVAGEDHIGDANEMIVAGDVSRREAFNCEPSGGPLTGIYKMASSHSPSPAPNSVTFPPEMLPSPDEGDEAEVLVENSDGSFRKVWPPAPSSSEGLVAGLKANAIHSDRKGLRYWDSVEWKAALALERAERERDVQISRANGLSGALAEAQATIASLVSALQALDDYWTEDFPEGPDVHVTKPGLYGPPIHESTAEIWRQIRSALSAHGAPERGE